MSKWEEAAKKFLDDKENNIATHIVARKICEHMFIAGAEYAEKEYVSALQAIVDYKPSQDWPTDDDLEFVKEIAKAALKEKE